MNNRADFSKIENFYEKCEYDKIVKILTDENFPIFELLTSNEICIIEMSSIALFHEHEYLKCRVLTESVLGSPNKAELNERIFYEKQVGKCYYYIGEMINNRIGIRKPKSNLPSFMWIKSFHLLKQFRGEPEVKLLLDNMSSYIRKKINVWITSIWLVSLVFSLIYIPINGYSIDNLAINNILILSPWVFLFFSRWLVNNALFKI